MMQLNVRIALGVGPGECWWGSDEIAFRPVIVRCLVYTSYFFNARFDEVFRFGLDTPLTMRTTTGRRRA